MPRTVLLAALVVVLGLAGATAWLLSEGPADRAAPAAMPSAARRPADGEDRPDRRPAASPASAMAGGASPDAAVPPAEATPAAAGSDPHGDVLATGRVQGRLVGSAPGGPPRHGARVAAGEVAGREPAAGEPVWLLLADDPWEPLASKEPILVDAMRSDGEGRFTLAARPGAEHLLVAGGGARPRLRLDGVAAGDELVLELAEPLLVEGRVDALASGLPLGGAFVRVQTGAGAIEGTTDEDGAFVLGPVADEALLVAAWAPGHDVAWESDVRATWGPVVLELPDGVEILGQVIDRESGRPVPGASVARRLAAGDPIVPPDSAGPEDPLHEDVVTAGGDGRFAFPPGPGRGVELEVVAEGYAPATRSPGGPREEVVVRLRPLEEVAGWVVAGDEAAPVPGSTVVLSGPSGELARGLADAEGAFVLSTGGWSGDKPLRLEAHDEDDRSAAVRVRRGREPVLHLGEPIEVTAQVLDGGDPVAGAHVAVLSARATTTTGTTGADGSVVLLHRRAAGTVTELHLEARHGGRASLPVVLDVSEGAPGEVVPLDLAAVAAVGGRVMDVAGASVPGASVRVRGGPAGHAGPDGTFRLAPVDPEASLTLIVTAEEHRRAEVETAPSEEVLVVLEPVLSWEGVVREASTGEPVPRFVGVLQAERLEDGLAVWKDVGRGLRPSGEPGGFSVALPAPGRLRVRVLARDYLPEVSAPVVFGGTMPPPPVELLLSRAAVLELLLVDVAGRPVPGAAVAVVDEEVARAVSDRRRSKGRLAKGVRPIRTGTDGRARFMLGEGGSFVVATARAVPLWPVPLLVAPGPPVEHRIVIGDTGDLELRISDASGQALSNVRITVRSLTAAAGSHDVRRKRRERGTASTVRFDALPPGAYSVHVRHDGHRTAVHKVLVEPARLAALDVVLVEGPAEAGGQRGQKARDGRGRGGR